MSLLYLAAESEVDEDFYASCATRLTGRIFNKIRLRNRKGDGVHAVQRQMKNAVVMARAAARGPEPVFFLAAIDNDRAPHAENAALNRALLIPEEQARPARAAWMLAVVEAVLTANRATWPCHVALAEPVEMMESWIVRARREVEPQPTPYFSKADSDRARLYYHPVAPPPQWKDLAALEQEQCGHADKLGFYEQVVREMDAEVLAVRSLSFRMFKEWLDAWPKGDSPA